MIVSRLVGVIALLSLGAGCVRRLPDYGHAKLTEYVTAAEQALAAGDHARAEQQATYGAYELFGSEERDFRRLAGIGEEREPELWARLKAVDTSLNQVVAESSASLTALAKKGDVAGYVRLRDFVAHRKKVVIGYYDNARLEEEERQKLLASACPAGFELFLRKGLENEARSQAVSCPDALQRVFSQFFEGPARCARVEGALASLRSVDVAPSLRLLLVGRATECVSELSASGASTDDRLVGRARGVELALEKLGVAVETEPRAALRSHLAALDERRTQAEVVKKESDAERERRLAPIRAELERAAARKDVQTACALAKANELQVPEPLRGAELAALAEREAHRKQAENPEWPATAWMHSLWLGRGAASPPPVAAAWDAPLQQPSWDWSGVTLEGDCLPMDAPPLAPRPSTKPASKVDALGFAVKTPVFERVYWKVLGYTCAPAQGRLVEYDVYAPSRVLVTRLRNDGRTEILETIVEKKVGRESVRLNSRTAAVSITVKAPVGHQALVFTVTREVDNLAAEHTQGFGFTLSGSRGGSLDNRYSFLGDLGHQYDAEVERLKKGWRDAARNRKAPNAEREEAFARLALLDAKDAEAVQYLREKYRLTGDNARSLSLPPIPSTCP